MATYVKGRVAPSASAAVLLAIGVAVLAPEVVAPGSKIVFDHSPQLHVAMTTFAAMCVQALPLVIAGALVSASITRWMNPSRWAKVIPRSRLGGVLVGAFAGVFVPTCECSSVAVARRMVASGVRPGSALTFMVAAPSLNPLIVVSTFIAFGQMEMAIARWLAALFAVVFVGLVVSVYNSQIIDEIQNRIEETESHGCGCCSSHRWLDTAKSDVIASTTYIIVGAGIAAGVSAFLPAEALAAISSNLWVSMALMIVIAVIASLCSLGDAFVAASFVGLSPVSLLVFLVVGPIIDLKLAAMMEGMMGPLTTKVVATAGIISAILTSTAVSVLMGWI